MEESPVTSDYRAKVEALEIIESILKHCQQQMAALMPPQQAYREYLELGLDPHVDTNDSLQEINIAMAILVFEVYQITIKGYTYAQVREILGKLFDNDKLKLHKLIQERDHTEEQVQQAQHEEHIKQATYIPNE